MSQKNMPPQAKPHVPIKATQNATENSRSQNGLITSQKIASALAAAAARTVVRLVSASLTKACHNNQPATTANGYPAAVIIIAE
jgi:hypothetical protein